MLRTIFVLAVATMVSVLAAPASAQEDARELFMRGQTAYQQGDYETAIQLWEQAYGIDPRPGLQFNLSQAHGRLGRAAQEIAALEKFLETAEPDSPYLADARARLASLRERVARTSIRIANAPEGAAILIDGEDRGRAPRPDPILVEPGSHRILITADGYDDLQSVVSVNAGQTVDVDATMSEAEDLPGPVGPRPDPGVPVASIALWGAGGAGIVAGAILGGLALGKSDGAVEGTSDADTAQAMALGADIAIGAGAACAAAGLIIYLMRHQFAGEREPAVTAAPSFGQGYAGAQLQGAF